MVSLRKLILNKIERSYNFPVLSKVQLDLLRAIDDNVAIETIAVKVNQDVSLTMNLLKIVNSAYYFNTSNRTIGNVEEAIIRLGLVEFKKILLTYTIINAFRHLENGDSFEQLWRHSLVTANMLVNTMELAVNDTLGKRTSGDLFSAGLLHDVGIILLYHSVPKAYLEVANTMQQVPGADLAKVEQDLLGIDHQEAGGILAERWRMPEFITTMIRHHHDPASYQGKYLPLLRYLVLIDRLTRIYGIDNLGIHRRNDTLIKRMLKNQQARIIPFILRFDDECAKSGELLRLVG